MLSKHHFSLVKQSVNFIISIIVILTNSLMIKIIQDQGFLCILLK